MTVDRSRFHARLAEARRLDDPSALLEAVPYARFLGLGFVRVGDELLGVLRYHDGLVGNPALPALHGGTVSALLESTAIIHVLWAEAAPLLPRTVNLTIDFLRSGKPVDTYARATTTKRGRRIDSVEVAAFQGDPERPIARALVHLRVTRADPDAV